MLDMSEYPRFSLAERERRWGRVRQLMRERACDCLVAPGTGDPTYQATSRNLSQIGGVGANAWVVFPLEGEPTAIVDNERRKRFVALAQDWIGDIRTGAASELVPDRLRELGLARGRIGFTQYQGAYRNADGAVPSEVMRKIRQALPEASIYGENEVLDCARLIKGAEEIAVLERATAASEEAIRVMCEVARPGVRQWEVWIAVAKALLAATGEFPQRVSLTANGPANVTSGMPVPDRIPVGALLSQEISARLQGYGAQCNHTIQVGAGGPSDYPEAIKLATDLFREVLAWARPGHTVGELCAYYESLFRDPGVKDTAGVLVFGLGLGDDYPRTGPRVLRQDEADLVLAPGWAFNLKPSVRLASGTYAQFGDCVVVTESGARRLGRRPLEPIVAG